tara:strand:- start:2427 stop:2804 length:378 start_codon:yes stop_codon:yes gene_type:complete
MATFVKTPYKMEEARKCDNVKHEDKIQIVVDKQLTNREKALFNTHSIIHRPKPSVISKDNIKLTSELVTKCMDCYCDMEKIDNLKDDNGIYYCSLCWEGCSGKNINAPAFIEKWGYEYEKVSFDY